ncbi:type II toxin-antitoxin system Phd/YefM family antitoxin [Streptosporangium sp. NBC_01639]|uniref:type II toxin-antitoxin system Phd/YefM family antitoxin n=1 Tax=Streptosporangium sp. NBC_01639 TaxID=2975948 RepID=UPI003866D56D|nr:type II toxin-antitoxin system Phd/YefM family antitoxin [Streptosporangium sp. NBC_01639]
MTKFVHVEPISSARAQLSETIARIGEQGLHAEPVVIGRRYKPEAVLISFELYERLADLIDEIQLAPLVRERLANSAASPDLTLEEVADSLGIEIKERGTGPSGGHESAA